MESGSNMLFRLLALISLILLSGCGVLRPALTGSGQPVRVGRTVEPFDSVSLSGLGSVTVRQGAAPAVLVTTDDNLQPWIETVVDRGELKIRPRRSLRPRGGLSVDVTVPCLRSARVSGAGNMNLCDVVAEDLEVVISGAGSLQATGFAESLSTRISGAGDADMRHLYCRRADVRISGAGDASVYAAESISANVSGAGEIACYGNPLQVQQSVSGAGDFQLRRDKPPARFSLGDSGRAPGHQGAMVRRIGPRLPIRCEEQQRRPAAGMAAPTAVARPLATAAPCLAGRAEAPPGQRTRTTPSTKLCWCTLRSLTRVMSISGANPEE